MHRQAHEGTADYHYYIIIGWMQAEWLFFPSRYRYDPHLSHLPPGFPWFSFYLEFHPSISLARATETWSHH